MDKSDLKENELSLIKYVEEQLDLDRHRLQQKFPFVGNFLMRLETEAGFWEDIPTACTNGKNIYVNALFYQGLTEDERLFVLAHEAFHCIMMHFLRVQNRDKYIWNIATDLEIHFLLTKEKMIAPFVLPHEKDWDGLSAEQIYEILIKEVQNLKSFSLKSGKELSNNKEKGTSNIGSDSDNESENGSGNGSTSNSSDDEDESENGSEDGKSPSFSRKLKESKNIKSSGKCKGLDEGFDRTIYDGKNPNDNEKFDADEVENEIVSKLKSTIDTVERSRGYVPGAARGIVEKFSKREINWRQMLSQFVTNCYTGNRKWLPPNKRHVYRGLYLPSMRDEILKAVVAIDTSGSCVGDLGKFFSELTGLLNSFGKYEITVIQCDADIQSVEKFDENCNVPNDKEWKSYGFGGTDFCPVFEYVDKNINDLNPSCLIYITDGYGSAPTKPPQYPVLWLLTSDGCENFCKWGTKTKFKAENR